MTAILLHLGHRPTRRDLGPFDEWVSVLVRTVEGLDAFRRQALEVDLEALAAAAADGGKSQLLAGAAADPGALRSELGARFERLRAKLVAEREHHLAIRASRGER